MSLQVTRISGAIRTERTKKGLFSSVFPQMLGHGIPRVAEVDTHQTTVFEIVLGPWLTKL